MNDIIDILERLFHELQIRYTESMNEINAIKVAGVITNIGSAIITLKDMERKHEQMGRI